MKFFKFSCGLGALVLSAGLMAACGSSDEDPPAGSGGSGGDAGGTGEAGSGGDPSGTGGTGTGGTGTGGSGTGGAPPTGGVECGGETCSSVSVMGFDLEGCCSENTRCGLDLTIAAALLDVPAGCVELDQPGDLDDTCPSEELDLAGIITVELDGCCRPSGTCGVIADIPMVGNLGCVDPEEYGYDEPTTACTPGAGDPPDAGPDANGDEEDAGADANGNGNGDEDGGADGGDGGD